MALQHPRNSPLHAELRQAKQQAPVAGDLDEQEQTSKCPTLLEKPSLLRPQGMESRQHPLQDSHSTQELAWDCSSSSQHSLLPLISAGKLLWAPSVPFFPKAWTPQAPLSILPGLAALHQLLLLIQTFKTESQTQAAFSYFSFPDFTLRFLGLWSAKSTLSFQYPLIFSLTSGKESVRKNAADLPHSGASPALAAFGPLIH